MGYTKQTWHDKPATDTSLNASRLGHMEDGIKDASNRLDVIEADGGAVVSVNGQTGAVVLTSGSVGAEPSGAVAEHVALSNPHAQYLQQAGGDARYVLQSDAGGFATDTELTQGLATRATTGDVEALDGRVSSLEVAPPAHTHTIAGIVASGTRDDTTFLRGDGTFAAPPSSGGGVTSHAALTGLGNDDHTQYLNTARGDARYYQQAAVDTAIAGRVPTSRTVTAGTGLSGGGALSADRTLAVSYGTVTGTAAQGNDSRITGAAQKASNLSDLASASAARSNLGLAAVAATGAYADLTGAPSSAAAVLSAPSGDATGATDVAAINAALAAVAGAGGGVVRARGGCTYQVGISGTQTGLGPSGTSSSRNVCVVIPSGVVLDMNDSTLQLRGSTEAWVVANAHTDNSVRDHDLGLINAVIDGRNITVASQPALQFCFLDRLTLANVKVINGYYQAAWVFDCTNSYFDRLDIDGVIGQGWTFGDPRATGTGHNGVYDSTFGNLRGSNITLLNTGSQPGNPYNFVLIRCTIDSIYAYNCSAGIKLQQPSSDVAIGSVIVDTCGEATALNSGFKIQGDATYPAGTDRPTRIRVAQVVARNQASVGLYIWHTQDCAVESYAGAANVLLHTASSDVILGGGINDYVGVISSRDSGGAGVRISNDNGGASAGPTGYRIGTVRVTNPGKTASASIKAGIRIDATSSGSFGHVTLIDDQTTHTMDIGVQAIGTDSVASFGSLSVTGQTGAAVSSASSGVAAPTAQLKNNYSATTDPLVTSDGANGYAIGSQWVNTTSLVAFECVSAATGAAVWRRLSADVQVFTTSGTWTRPAWTALSTVALLGCGGGGGAGYRGAASTARVGGGGGGGGGYAERTFQTSDLTATVSVTLGTPGTGAAGQTTDDTAGANGTTGGVSQFASFLRAGGGTFGTGGSLGAGGGAGTGAAGPITGANGGAGATTGGAGGAGASAFVGAGGGAGGGVSAGNTANNGGAGSPMTSNGGTAGTAGAAPGGAGGAGGSTTATQSIVPGGGGGGGAGNSGGAGGAGGAGGIYGAGGGGGGASVNGSASGAGGAGAGGICVVISR